MGTWTGVGQRGRTPLERGICHGDNHGDMGRGKLARTYDSREGDMSWGQLVMVLTDNL
jgi:hypothetical protein